MSETALQLQQLLHEVRSCTFCTASLPLGANPVLQANRNARLLIARQVPGKRVHLWGNPFDNASGDRLRVWPGWTGGRSTMRRHSRLCRWGFVIREPASRVTCRHGPNARPRGARSCCHNCHASTSRWSWAITPWSTPWRRTGPRARRQCLPATSARARSSCAPSKSAQ